MQPGVDIGIVRERQAARKAAPTLRRLAELSCHKSTILAFAREAVDQAIKEAVAAEVERRRSEIEELTSPTGPPISLLIAAVEQATGFSLVLLREDVRRERSVARARWLLLYLIAALRRDISLNEIGRLIRRDRSTVAHGLDSFNERRTESPLSIYCGHPSVVELLNEADKRPPR